MTSTFRRPLPASSLRWRCDPARFPPEGATTRRSLVDTIGQEGAIEALRLGLELYGPGYNVFVEGLPGTGRAEIVRVLLEEMKPLCRLPDDRIYVNNFRHPERPRLLVLRRGRGIELARALERAIANVAEGIRRLVDDATFGDRRDEITARSREEERRVVDAFEKECADAGFVAGAVEAGGATEPDVLLVVGEQTVAMSDLDAAIRAGAVPAADEAKIRARQRELRAKLSVTMRKNHAILEARRRALEELESAAAHRILDETVAELRASFDQPEVIAHLQEARAAFVERFSVYAQALLAGVGAAGVRSDAYRHVAEDVLREFLPNPLLDPTDEAGCPTVVESQPTWTNLFGQIERDIDAKGNARADFLMIRPGSLLRADGGYLILHVADVLAQPDVWSELKRVLKHGRLEIRPPDFLLAASPIVLHPDPIAVNVKVVLLGDEGTYGVLREADPDFAEIFKVKVVFERDTPLDRRALARYGAFVRRVAADESRLPIDRRGLAALAEEGVREAGRQGRISVRFNRIADLVREADFAARSVGAATIGPEHVAMARRAAERRAGVAERRVREAVREGMILVETKGSKVGQVNGLAVYDFGDHRFGSVARITATVGGGQAGIVNVERLAELSGSSHDKGVMILSGYLRETFGAEKPLAFTASLVFEQSYGGVEGDSATCAEVVALLSAISRVPLRQDLAVTGSMNQHGDVQAVGGVNDKIEGFFDVCAETGLLGTQGVVIPRANAKDLMLREDVVEACVQGRFSIYAVDRIEEAVELLTGVRARGGGPGRFHKGSVYASVAQRLARLAGVAGTEE